MIIRNFNNIYTKEGEFYKCKIADAKEDWVIHDIVRITQTSDTHIIGTTLISLFSTEDEIENSWHLPFTDKTVKEIVQVSKIENPELFI